AHRVRSYEVLRDRGLLWLKPLPQQHQASMPFCRSAPCARWHPVAQRWADLLAAEHVATQVLTAHGHASAYTELIASNERLCLESTRFDRIGHYGRRGTIMLAAWSDAHDGLRDNWAAAAKRMQANQWISADTLQQIRLRWWFGRLIGNTDMHFGNLAFYLDDRLPL
ncbi:MAG: HipA domain-containing protein, partial [Rhodanobacter sp.]